MTTKQERLLQVYDYLRSLHGIHTQVDFANAIKITRPALSSAMNGKEAYLTKNLFQKICGAFPGVFNLDYLLTGEGCLLMESELANEKQAEIEAALKEYRANHRNGTKNLPDSRKESGIDQASLVNALLAAKDETIASLRQQIAEQKEMIELLRKSCSDLRSGIP